MLHTKFQGHWSAGSGKEDSLKAFIIYGHGGHIWSCDLDGLYIFSFPQPKEALQEIWLHLDQWLLRSCLRLSYNESPRSKVKQ